MRTVLQRATTRGFRKSLRHAQAEWTILRAHRRGRREARTYRGARSLRLHLGCGSNLKEGWVNIDPQISSADLTLDLREPLPFDDRSCEIIHSEHFLEHLGYPHEVQRHLRECYRVLEPGGRISAGVPNTEPALRAYVARDPDWLQRVKTMHPTSCRRYLEHINFHFRQGGEHLMAYDEETLLGTLEEAGFVEARRRSYDPALDSARRRNSLFVEARRP